MSQVETVEVVDTVQVENANQRIWSHEGDSWYPDDATQQEKKLEVAVYHVSVNPIRGMYLKQTEKEFTFDYKIYGTESAFIKRVMRTYEASNGNMGVLLNGIKGTGKSVTAKLICNQMKMPVIVVPEYFDGLPKFLNGIHEEVIVFIDEYEKMYNDWKTSSILTVMDGVMSGAYRRLFLLTTNDLHINENMLQRPSRIYYLKPFDNIAPEVVQEVLDDMLEWPEYRDDIVKFVDEMNIITIDLVKAIIHEVNIHGESPNAFKDIFNVRNHKTELYDIFDVTDMEKPKTIGEGVRMDFQFNDSNVGRQHYGGHGMKSLGAMVKVFDKNTALFEAQEYETININPDDMNDDDYDKLEKLKADNKKPQLKTVRRVYRKEQSSQYGNLRQYII